MIYQYCYLTQNVSHYVHDAICCLSLSSTMGTMMDMTYITAVKCHKTGEVIL